MSVLLSPCIDDLVTALSCLPGVGPKSAQRMAFYLLQRGRSQATTLSEALQNAVAKIGHCDKCYNFTELKTCQLCQNTKREQNQLCVVESPIDVLAIEESGSYRGLYFVLMGHLSPLDGIGPNDIGINALQKRVHEHQQFQEIILATNPTVEGEATAHYIAELFKPLNIQTTRIAHGVPLGGNLEFIDGGTLAQSLLRRETIV